MLQSKVRGKTALCKKLDPKFSKIHSKAEKLTPLGVIFRYPDTEIYPEKKALITAIEDAKAILTLVQDRINRST